RRHLGQAAALGPGRDAAGAPGRLPRPDPGRSGAGPGPAPVMRVCVFCGSAPGTRPLYLEAARAFGRTLGELGLGLVYGGSSLGLMGALADAALGAGAEVHGVIPEFMIPKEIAHPGLTQLHVM